MATRIAQPVEMDPSSLTPQPQTHNEHIVTSDNARAHFGHNYNGDVSYTTNVQPAASSTAVDQPRLLPRSPNSQYVGYVHVLDRLDKCFLQQDDADHDRGQTVCVLQGMGGVGKSETVLQFLGKNEKALCTRFWAIFWVDCESEASAQADFERISNICGWSLAGKQAITGVKDRLASSKKTSLLILDNCDDTETDYGKYIPHGSQVSVLLTSRLLDAGDYASVDPGDPKSRFLFELDGLDTGSAIDLLLKSSKIQERNHHSTEQARKIVTALDRHPLAVTVASSLICRGVYQLEEYADALESQLAQKELLETDSVQARYRKVSTTFEVSAGYLQISASTDPSAKAALALLDILGFMHHHNVSEEMFVRAWEYEETVLSKYGGDDGDEDMDITHLSVWHVARCRSIFSPLPLRERTQLFRKSRAHLHRLSLVNVDRTQNCMSLHMMVHAWARDRVSCPNEVWTATASILALCAQRPDVSQLPSRLVSHYETNFVLGQDIGKANIDQWEICRIWYIYANRMYDDDSIATMKICLQLLQQIEELCRNRPEQLALAEAIHLLGLAYGMDGQKIKAISALEHAAKSFEKLAEDHPDRLASQSELACARVANGQVTEAIDVLEHVMKVREKLAEDHPDRLILQHELACAYLADKQVDKAVNMLEHVTKVHKKLAEDHPHRLVSQHSLASAYLANGQITEAIDMLEHVVKVRDAKLAEDHPNRLVSQHGLARAYFKNRQITESIDILEHVVKVKAKLTEDNRSRLSSQHELACAYLENCQITEAIYILEHVVKGKETLAEDNPSRLSSQHELARAYWSNDQIIEALEVLKPVVAIEQRKYDASHPDRILSEKMLGAILKEEEELALDRLSDSDSSSGPREPNAEIEQCDEAPAEVVPTCESQGEARDQLEQHSVPTPAEPLSGQDPDIRPSKRERFKMALRLRRK